MADAILTKKDGVVTMDKSFDYLCSTLKNGIYTVSIKRKVEPRTLSQNALMWLWFSCIYNRQIKSGVFSKRLVQKNIIYMPEVNE